MKKLLLPILLIGISLHGFSQSESEPNDTFDIANEEPYGQLTDGSISTSDQGDYFKAVMTDNGALRFHVQVTNTGSTPANILFKVYDGLTFTGNVINPNLLYTFNFGIVQPGETIEDSMTVCGRAADNHYYSITGDGDFDYTVQWDPFAIAADDGSSNDTPGSATSFNFNLIRGGGIHYEFWGNPDFDPVDYFKSTLPVRDYSNVRLYLHGQNTDCGAPGWIKYECFKNSETTAFASGFIGNNGNVLSFEEVNNSIPISNMNSGDVLYVKITASGPFNYRFIYKEEGSYDDDEDNCCTYNAISIGEHELAGGHVGEYDFLNDEYIDQYDTYKFTMPVYGGIQLNVTAETGECSEEIYDLAYTLLDKNGNYAGDAQLAYWDNYPACGEQGTATVVIRGLVPDVYYLQLTNEYHGIVNYKFSYALADTTLRFDTEPNNDQASATPIVPGEVKKGNIRFRSFSPFDQFDYYKMEMPADGKIVVHLTASSQESYELPNSDFDKLHIDIIGRPAVVVSPGPDPLVIVADSNYVNTSTVCEVGAGTIYFKVNAQHPYEYELSYDIIDTSSVDNDIEPNNTKAQAIPIAGGQLKKGHLQYYTNSDADANDYYKIVFSVTDSLKLYVQATNTSCTNGRRIAFSGVNKNNVSVFNRYIGNNTSVAIGQTIMDSVKIKVTAPDTIYIRFYGDVNVGTFKYQLATNPLAPSSTFSISGDTTVCLGPQVYKAIHVVDENVTYNWSLPDGGGTLSFSDSIATVNWNTTGNRRVQLYLSNNIGVSQTKTLNVVVNNNAPTQTPVAFNFARTLSTNSLPPGGGSQWYRNDVLIPGAIGIAYYAATSGTYTVKFTNDCGSGPVSNAISFPADAQSQTISFPHTPDITLTPTAKVKLPATTNSGLPVYYQKITGAAFIQNDTLYIAGGGVVVGNVIVKASQPGDDVYSPATDKYDTITVVKGSQLINFDSIPDHVLNSTLLTLTATSSMGLSISYSIVAGNTLASISTNKLTKKGAGLVTVRASQNGNANYNAATPVDRTFCIGLRTLDVINGDANPCLNMYTYTTEKIPGANYVWNLSGGGILTTHNDTARVQWQTLGTYTLGVKANSPCDAVYTNEQQLVITTSNNTPSAVTGMVPANNVVDLQLPLQLSWIPGSNTVSYDLYIWDASTSQPATPYAANLPTFTYTLPKNSLPHNKTYNWKVVAKNPCSQTDGPIQQFTIIPLPDLVLSNISAPLSANSGQTISISWQVTNIGPGRTTTNHHWNDAVFLSYDTFPNYHIPPHIGDGWSSLASPLRPLILATKQNLTALDSGQSYTNTVTYTLPQSFSQPVWVYVIADYSTNVNSPLQVTRVNDTARTSQPIDITLSPTPDLRVDSVFTPSAVFSGSNINVAYKVKNYSVLTPPGSQWTDSIFISQNPLFNRNEAIPLFRPKGNGSYYPNAVAANATRNTQLQHDSVYTESIAAVIPNDIFGTWFIYVQANANTSLYEGALANNNFNRSQVEIYLTPTPKLTVSTLDVPVTTASTTQPIGINWNIKNEGFYDNIEKNRGHYFTFSACAVACIPPKRNILCPATIVSTDSAVFGSSYWVDRVYLSTNPSSLDISHAFMVKETKHGVQNSGLYLDNWYMGCGHYGSSGNLNVFNVIKPSSNFPVAENFAIPDSLATGTYYVYVYTNPTRSVFEYPGTPQIRRSAAPILIERPDVVIPSLTVPPASGGGQTISINYDVLNTGAGAVYNHARRDRLYISNFPAFDGSAVLIGEQNFAESLPVGTTVSHVFTYTLPVTATGNKYFYVWANYDSSFKETTYTNNRSSSAVTLVTAATPADLVVSSIQLADSVFTIFPNTIKYTVTNNGAGSTLGTWTDSVYFSCSPVFNANTSYFAGRREQTRTLANGGNYTDSFLFTIPKMAYEINACFPATAYNTAYFFIKTNANNGTYEASNTNNNVTASGTRVLINPLVDHIVKRVNSADVATVARPVPVTWTLKNQGYNPNKINYYVSYVDGLYFSADSLLDVNDVEASSYLKYNLINRNDTLNDSKSVITPNIPTGDYYLIAKTNIGDKIPAEKVLNNNTNLVRDITGTAKKIHVIQPLLPDLVDTVMVSPVSVAAGQPVTVIHRVTNNGAGVTFPASWQDRLFLSHDFVPNNLDDLLKTKAHNGMLNPLQSYNDTLSGTIRLTTAPGNYVLIAETNASANANMFESNMANNNGFGLINVYTPPASDLTVANVNIPDTVYLGYTIDTVKWIVQNISENGALGVSKDGIYLSQDDFLDSTATLIGIRNKTINMPPLDQDTLAMAPLVETVLEGDYKVWVKTDLQDNIVESDKDNNATASAGNIYVKIKELVLNIPENNTLQTVNRYYKLLIPDSLLGSTIRVTLKTNDSLTMRNEMYIAGSYIPSPSHFDYRFEVPNYGNQQIVIADVSSNIYYIRAGCVSPNPVLQQITLKAEVLPFAILDVNSPSGGNIGNVTVKISGSLFTNDMTAKIIKGTTTITASAVYYTNSTTVYATFNLHGAPLGIYDLSLIKADMSTAILPNGFSVVLANNGGLITGSGPNTGPGNGNEPGCDPGASSGLNSQLVMEIVAPPAAIVGTPILVQINYSNPTNSDIPAQSRTLYSDEGVKLALTQAGVANGTTALYLELTEQGGPPGIIRAGGSGSITVYTKAPPGIPEDHYVTLKLK